MGASRVGDRDADRMLDRWNRQARPVGLGFEEVRTTGGRREAETPVPVRAKIPMHVSYVENIEVSGEVVAWTRKAVLVHTVIDEVESYVWVWANAVERV